MNTMQTGRVLGKENLEFVGVINGGNLSSYSIQESTFFPHLEGRIRVGLNDRSDIGITMNSNTFVGLNYKRQLLGERNSMFALAIGSEVSITPLAMFTFGSNATVITFPLHCSFHKEDKFAFYFTPRYIFSAYTIYGEKSIGRDYYREEHSLVGYTAGFKIGEQKSFFLEVSYFDQRTFSPTQIGIGIVMYLDKFDLPVLKKSK